MTSSDWLLVFSVVSLLCTLSALLRGKHLRWFMPLYFFVAWLTGELAVFHIAWQALAVLAMVASGALASPAGVLGLVLCALSWVGLYWFHRQGQASAGVFEQALEEALGVGYRDEARAAGRPELPEAAVAKDWLKPFAMAKPGVELMGDIPYGDAGERHHLDIYRPQGLQAGARRPVLLQIHGGGWMIGAKEQQALPLMNHLASRGWVCVTANYRLSPGVKFPEHLIDVKRALAWVREHIADYGGDPAFVATTGGSAGGHLCSLLALTANDKTLQPGFEQVDTSVSACVPFYGVYDFLDRQGHRGVSSMTGFLNGRVMPVAPEHDPQLWDQASPVTQVTSATPPFLVIAGNHDSLVFVEEARHFVAELNAASVQPVAYAELPLAQHAFDIFHSPRADNAVFAVSRFLETVYVRECGLHKASQNLRP